MKRILGLCLLLSVGNVFAAKGFYVGLGGGWGTTNEVYNSTLSTSNVTSGYDTYNTNNNNLLPMVQAGYFAPFRSDWLWGVNAAYQYLGYQTPNVGGEHGQYIPNASFSSINFFGPGVVRDFASQTTVNNEVLLTVYLGRQLPSGFAYLGVGPAFFTATNTIYMTAIHIPHGTGSHLVSSSISANQNVWGGAAQVGYNYFLTSAWFVNLNYTYLQTANANFNNSVNAAKFNGHPPGAKTLTLNRTIDWSTQTIMLSLNTVIA